jgi:hypothetical protein
LIRRSWSLFACAAAIAAAQSFAGFCLEVGAQPVTRMKARLTVFDGHAMTLEPLGDAKGREPLTVLVTPDTRYVASNRSQFNKIGAGDYVGAAVTMGRGGMLRATDVYLYAAALRGSSEGRFPDGDRIIINGTVTAAKPTAPEDKQDGTLSVHYRGALLSNAGSGKTLCEGRASPAAYASPLACAADATIQVLPGATISALTMGDASLLAPGSLVTVAMTHMADGRNLAAGVTVERAPVTVEKPQSPP